MATTKKAPAKKTAPKADAKPKAAKAKTKPMLKIVPAEAPVPEAVVTNPETVTPEATATTKAKGKKAKATTPDAPKKLSALDAAATVLAEAGTPLNTKVMIEAMAAQSLWTSPGGKTPAATLYSAILREISVKGKESRFRKVAKGQFEATGT